MNARCYAGDDTNDNLITTFFSYVFGKYIVNLFKAIAAHTVWYRIESTQLSVSDNSLDLSVKFFFVYFITSCSVSNSLVNLCILNESNILFENNFTECFYKSRFCHEKKRKKTEWFVLFENNRMDSFASFNILRNLWSRSPFNRLNLFEMKILIVLFRWIIWGLTMVLVFYSWRLSAR